jgi:hypothetical protein
MDLGFPSLMESASCVGSVLFDPSMQLAELVFAVPDNVTVVAEVPQWLP